MVRRGGQGSLSSWLLVTGDPPRGGPGYFMGGSNLGDTSWVGGQVTQRNGSSHLVHTASPFLPPPKGGPSRTST